MLGRVQKLSRLKLLSPLQPLCRGQPWKQTGGLTGLAAVAGTGRECAHQLAGPPRQIPVGDGGVGKGEARAAPGSSLLPSSTRSAVVIRDSRGGQVLSAEPGEGHPIQPAGGGGAACSEVKVHHQANAIHGHSVRRPGRAYHQSSAVRAKSDEAGMQSGSMGPVTPASVRPSTNSELPIKARHQRRASVLDVSAMQRPGASRRVEVGPLRPTSALRPVGRRALGGVRWRTGKAMIAGCGVTTTDAGAHTRSPAHPTLGAD